MQIRSPPVDTEEYTGRRLQSQKIRNLLMVKRQEKEKKRKEGRGKIKEKLRDKQKTSKMSYLDT